MANPVKDTRPPVKSRVVSVRLDAVEYGALTTYAAKTGVALSSLMRAAVLDVVQGSRMLPRAIAPAVAPREALSPEVTALLTEFKRVGVNVNQLARLSNSRGAMVVTAEDDRASVTAILTETKSLVSKVLNMLGHRSPV